MPHPVVTANSPRWQAVGAEGSDIDIAAVHSDIASYCWYISNGKSLFSQVVQDCFTKGIGYMMVDIDAYRKLHSRHKGVAKIKNLSATLHEKQKMEGCFNEHGKQFFDW